MHVLQERKPVRIGSGVQPAALVPYLGRGHGTNQKVKRGGPIGKQRLPPSRVEPVQVQLETDNRLENRREVCAVRGTGRGQSDRHEVIRRETGCQRILGPQGRKSVPPLEGLDFVSQDRAVYRPPHGRDQPAVGEHVETKVFHGLHGEAGGAGEQWKACSGAQAQENGT